VVALVLLVLWIKATPVFAALSMTIGNNEVLVNQVLVLVWEGGIAFLSIVTLLEVAKAMRHRSAAAFTS
jgi:hypothetical protein